MYLVLDLWLVAASFDVNASIAALSASIRSAGRAPQHPVLAVIGPDQPIGQLGVEVRR
jgi:hypothetical protein